MDYNEQCVKYNTDAYDKICKTEPDSIKLHNKILSWSIENYNNLYKKIRINNENNIS